MSVRSFAWLVMLLLGVVVLSMLDLQCTDGGREPDVLSRVKGELSVGRKELATERREQLAALMRDLRVYRAHLIEKGEKRQAWRVTQALRELEERHAQADAQVHAQ